MSWHLSVVDGGRPRSEAPQGDSTLGTLARSRTCPI